MSESHVETAVPPETDLTETDLTETDPIEARVPHRLAPGNALRNTTWNEVWLDAASFVHGLVHLREHEKGKMAALRRGAGETIGEARNLTWMQGRLSQEPRRTFDEQYFLVATLFDLNRMPPIAGDFGETMRQVGNESSDSFERRFLVLLEAEFNKTYDDLDGWKSSGGELSYRLAQMVKLAASRKVGVNWPLLLADLCCWELPGKPVQKKWARKYYAPQLKDENAGTKVDEANAGEPAHDQGDTDAN